MLLKKELKDKLPQLSLVTLSELDRGRLARQFGDAVASCIENISKYPCRDGKAETRVIDLKVYLTPKLKMAKKAMENAYGHSEIDVPEISGLIVRAKVKSQIPDTETADVTMAVDVVNGRIVDARFNPLNNDQPDQLELFDEEAAEAE